MKRSAPTGKADSKSKPSVDAGAAEARSAADKTGSRNKAPIDGGTAAPQQLVPTERASSTQRTMMEMAAPVLPDVPQPVPSEKTEPMTARPPDPQLAEAILAAAREDAARIREEAEAEAEGLRAEATATRREAEQLAEHLRADADLYRARTEEVLESSRAAQVADAEEARLAMERELSTMREEALVEAVQRRDALLRDPLAPFEKARAALEALTEELAEVAATLASAAPARPAGATAISTAGIDRAREALLAAADRLAEKADALRVESAPSRRQAAGGAATEISARDDRAGELARVNAADGARLPAWLALAGVAVLGIMMALTLREIGVLESAVAEQRAPMIVKAAGPREGDAPAEPRAAAEKNATGQATAPMVAGAEKAPAATEKVTAAAEKAPAATERAAAATEKVNDKAAENTGERPPAMVPAQAAVAEVPVKAAAAPSAAKGAEPAPQAREPIAAGTPLTDEEKASASKLLGDRSASEWLKKRLIIAGRRSAKLGKIEPEDLEKLIAAVNGREAPPLGREELDDLKKIRHAQELLLDCKLIEVNGVDLQLGSGTRARLREVAAGDVRCNSADPSERAELDALRHALATPEWQSFLDDDRALRLAQSALAPR